MVRLPDYVFQIDPDKDREPLRHLIHIFLAGNGECTFRGFLTEITPEGRVTVKFTGAPRAANG